MNFSQYTHQQQSEASSAARIKLEQHIHGKISTARQVLDRVEAQIIDDQVVRGASLKFVTGQTFHADAAQPFLMVETPDGANVMHDHALMQIASKAEVPAVFTRKMMTGDQWRQELLAHNFNEIYSRGNGNKYLLRSVGGELRGFLSDRFKRMDARPLLDAFCVNASQLGAIPVEGFALETKMRMRCLLPVVFEPIAGEVFAFGVEFGTSDFGDGGLYLSVFLLRLTCLNGATMADVMRKIHLGSRLTEDITFSQQTYELDTRANAAALGDAVKFALNPARLETYMEVLKKANDQPVSIKAANDRFKKLLNKDEAEAAFNAFKSPDVVNLPAGQSVYRMSNAISWIANYEEISRARQLDLQKIAGDVLPAAAGQADVMPATGLQLYGAAAAM